MKTGGGNLRLLISCRQDDTGAYSMPIVRPLGNLSREGAAVEIVKQFWKTFLSSLKEAIATWRGTIAGLTIIGIILARIWPGLPRLGRIVLEDIPLLILWSRFIWAFSKFHLTRAHVSDIQTKVDLEDALSLYDHRMPEEDRHPLNDIRGWWTEEQKRKPEQRESREIFLFTKAEGRVCNILFATYSRGLLNIYRMFRRSGV